jgi:hypothetical protein
MTILIKLTLADWLAEGAEEATSFGCVWVNPDHIQQMTFVASHPQWEPHTYIRLVGGTAHDIIRTQETPDDIVDLIKYRKAMDAMS